jgi:hypothetical protein
MRTYSFALGWVWRACPFSRGSASPRWPASSWNSSSSCIRYLPYPAGFACGIRYTTVKITIHTTSTKCQ